MDLLSRHNTQQMKAWENFLATSMLRAALATDVNGNAYDAEAQTFMVHLSFFKSDRCPRIVLGV